MEIRKPEQVMHNIDLDTVMPGLVGHDFGDAIRFGTAQRVHPGCGAGFPAPG